MLNAGIELLSSNVSVVSLSFFFVACSDKLSGCEATSSSTPARSRQMQVPHPEHLLRRRSTSTLSSGVGTALSTDDQDSQLKSHLSYRACGVAGGLGRSASVRVRRAVHGFDGGHGMGLRAEVRRGAILGQHQEGTFHCIILSLKNMLFAWYRYPRRRVEMSRHGYGKPVQ